MGLVGKDLKRETAVPANASCLLLIHAQLKGFAIGILGTTDYFKMTFEFIVTSHNRYSLDFYSRRRMGYQGSKE